MFSLLISAMVLELNIDINPYQLYTLNMWSLLYANYTAKRALKKDRKSHNPVGALF